MGLFSDSFDNDNWIADWDSSFSFDGHGKDSGSWLSGIWDWAKSDTGSSFIGGLAGGLYDWYKTDKQGDYYDKTRKDRNLQWAQEMALKEKALAQQAAAANAALNLQKAIFRDKVNTRKAHNDSINTAPNSARDVTWKG